MIESESIPRASRLTLNAIKDEQEQVESLLEGLLIFPNQSGLHSAYKKSISVFEHEQIFLTQQEEMNKEVYNSIRASQKKILKIFRKEINNPSRRTDVVANAGTCGSC